MKVRTTAWPHVLSVCAGKQSSLVQRKYGPAYSSASELASCPTPKMHVHVSLMHFCTAVVLLPSLPGCL